MKAKDLVLKVVNETEDGKYEIKEFKSYMTYESFVGNILADAEILRPTGIKDVTGKQIYEGDIVEFYNDVYYILKPGIAKIIYELGAFQMVNERYGADYLGNMDIDDMCIRVIGNIYENPKLLKSEVEQ